MHASATHTDGTADQSKAVMQGMINPVWALNPGPNTPNFQRFFGAASPGWPYEFLESYPPSPLCRTTRYNALRAAASRVSAAAAVT